MAVHPVNLHAISRVVRQVDDDRKGGVFGHTRSEGHVQSQQVTGVRKDACETARAMLDFRKEAAHAFPDGVISDPALEMLLDLFLASEQGERRTVSEAIKAITVAQTTGLRWLVRLEADGLVIRDADPVDRRRTFVALSEAGRATVADLLTRSILRVAT